MFKNFLILTIFLLLSFSCNSQNQNNNLSIEMLLNGHNFLFEQFNGNQLLGELLLFNISKKNSIKILDNVTEYSNPRFINKDLDLLIFAENSLHRGNFYLINSIDKVYKKISIENKLNFVSQYNSIKNFDTCLEGEIIFGFRNTIYTYSINSDKINLIKTFKNIGIRDVAYDNKTGNVSFSYHHGIDTLDQTFLGVYLIRDDTTLLTNEEVLSLGNFSEDGNKICFKSSYGKSGFYDLTLNTTEYFSFNIDNQTLSSPHFINNNELLLLSFNLDDLFHQEIYLYDLQNKRVKEKLTENNYGKRIIKFCN